MSKRQASLLGGPIDGWTLDTFMSHGEQAVEDFARIAHQAHELLIVSVPSGAQLFFTDKAYFPIPIVGERAILGIPLTPFHFVALPERGFNRKYLQEWLRNPARVTAFSVGITGAATRVIVPPDLFAAPGADRDRLGQSIRDMQAHGTRLRTLIGEACRIAGLS